MFIFAAVLFVMAVLVLTVKRPADRLNPSVLYKVDKRVVATVLFILCGCFLFLGYAEVKGVLR